MDPRNRRFGFVAQPLIRRSRRPGSSRLRIVRDETSTVQHFKNLTIQRPGDSALQQLFQMRVRRMPARERLLVMPTRQFQRRWLVAGVDHSEVMMSVPIAGRQLNGLPGLLSRLSNAVVT